MLATSIGQMPTKRKYNEFLEKIVADGLCENFERNINPLQLQIEGDEESQETRTTIVSMHLAQMKEWGSRGGGIRLKPTQDFQNYRRNFINTFLKENNFYTNYDQVISNLTARGEVLWYYSPDSKKQSGYNLKFYVGGKYNPNSTFHIFKKRWSNNIECLALLDEYDKDYYSATSRNTYNYYGDEDKEYILQFITKEKIIKFKLESLPFADIKYSYFLYRGASDSSKALNRNNLNYEIEENILQDIPGYLVKNIEVKSGTQGISDFDTIAPLIIEHNRQANAISENLLVFGNPTLLSTRDKESTLENTTKFSTWASENGFRSLGNKIRNAVARVPKWITGVKAEERFAYLSSPDPVSGDMNNYFRRNGELAQWILGGIDPLGISANATFGEIKSLFGRIENTALKKSKSLLGHNGLSSLVMRLIEIEENKAKNAMVAYLLQQQMIEILPEKLNSGIWQELFMSLKNIGLNIPGLPPSGEIEVNWEYSRRVFMLSTRDKLDLSIDARNKREDGMTQSAVLADLYPEKDDEEIRAMMSGFSPRVVQNDLVGIQGVLQLYRELLVEINPLTNQPWAIDLKLYDLVNQAVLTLEKELQYNNPEFVESPSTNLDIILEKIREIQIKNNTIYANNQGEIKQNGGRNSKRV